MKKLLSLCVSISLLFTMTGCSAGQLVDRFISDEDTAETAVVSDKSRVYMDEVSGNLLDFDGSSLTVQSDEETYVFDVSQATLECADGMITGDEISVIYEGQLTDADTSNVKILKVVDEYHKKTQLEEQTIHGKVQSLTANTITIKPKKGNASTWPITGTEQYYQSGIRANAWVYIHYKGTLPESDDSTAVLNANHLKVLSISDVDPLEVPAPTPTPEVTDENQQNTQEQKLQAVIETVNLNTLQATLTTVNSSISLDLSSIPCYFPGGLAPGSHVSIIYTGTFDGSSLDGLSILGITGEDPATMKESRMDFTVSGEIQASTANTITIRTYDGAVVTCNTDNASRSLSNGLCIGASVTVTFNPAASRSSNIYTALKIQDAL